MVILIPRWIPQVGWGFLSALSVCLLCRPIGTKPSCPSFICSADCAASNRLPGNSRGSIQREMGWWAAGCGGSWSIVGSDGEEWGECSYHPFPLREERRKGGGPVGRKTISHKMPRGGTEYASKCNVCRNISLIVVLMPRERGGGRHTQRKREKEGLNLATETFTSCAVLNAKHVAAYCRARLFQSSGPFASLWLRRGGGVGTGYVRASFRQFACLKLLIDLSHLLPFPG